MIVVLGTGGTIAAASTRPGDEFAYKAGVIAIARTMEALGRDDSCQVESEQVLQLDSKDMDFHGWKAVTHRVAAHLARTEVEGVVVTHGTDTMEETAYFLHRVLAPSKPVVFTGAMRPPGALLTDGQQNLREALTVARDPHAKGVVVVMNGTIFHPVGLRKQHAHDLNAFCSGEGGPLGVIVDHRVQCYRPWPDGDPLGIQLLDRPIDCWPHVEIVLNAVNANGDAVRILTSHVDGFVVAATGNGSVSERLSAALEKAEAQGVAIRLSTRCASGRIVGSNWTHRVYPLDSVQLRLAWN